MAYRFAFASPGERVEFALSPLSGYSFGPFTFAVLLKRNDTTGGDSLISFNNSSLVSRGQWRMDNASSGSNLFLPTNSTSAVNLPSTSVWYLLAVTRPSAPTPARFHNHNGTSWSHVAGSGDAGTLTLVSGDRFQVGRDGNSGDKLEADVVCVGIKKADSSDVAIETLSRTAWSAWTGFGFDWLIGFDSSLEAAGILQDQASPGTGDEIAINGTIQVSDPPGWSWAAAAAPAFVPQIVIT